MLSLTIGEHGGQPLVDQIVAGIKRQIDDRHLRSGARLPSIRRFAETMGVSPSTVVEAYDRLVAEGIIRARRGSGFYVTGTNLPPMALAEMGLIDEYQFIVHPKIAGHGPTLFAGLSKPIDLKLVNRREFASGAVVLTYEPRK